MIKQPLDINFKDNIKFDNKIVSATAKIVLRAKESYSESRKILEKINQHTKLKNTSIEGVSQILNQIDNTIDEMDAEAKLLMVDNERFKYTEHYNEELVQSMLDSIMGLGGSFGSSGSSDAFLGVKIDDFGMFTDMTPDEFFEYMRANGGYYGVDQGCLEPTRYIQLNTVSQGDGDMGVQRIYYQINDNYSYLVDFLGEEYGFSKKDACKAMSMLNSIGACTYATTASAIIYEYRDQPERFESCYGFPLYLSTGQDNYYTLNSEQVILDMFVFANSEKNETGDSFTRVTIDGQVELGDEKLFSIDGEGKRSINDEFTQTSSFPDINSIDGGETQILTSKAKTQVYYSLVENENVQFGFNTALLTSYICENDPGATVSVEKIFIHDDNNSVRQSEMPGVMADLSERISQGQSIYVQMYPSENKGYKILRESGKIDTINPGKGGHAMYGTEVETKDGYTCLDVATWGENAQIPEGFLYDAGGVEIFAIDIKFDGK